MRKGCRGVGVAWQADMTPHQFIAIQVRSRSGQEMQRETRVSRVHELSYADAPGAGQPSTIGWAGLVLETITRLPSSASRSALGASWCAQDQNASLALPADAALIASLRPGLEDRRLSAHAAILAVNGIAPKARPVPEEQLDRLRRRLLGNGWMRLALPAFKSAGCLSGSGDQMNGHPCS